MTDRHLNLFYCYSARDKDGKNEGGKDKPIEDNLTRAFVQTVRMLSSGNRKRFLDELFAPDDQLCGCDFSLADVALQEQVPEERNPRGRTDKDKYHVERIVTISTSTRVPECEGNTRKDRRPDAWIFDGNGTSYCLLVESKCRGYPIDRAQVREHGEKWFLWDKEWDNKEYVTRNWLRRTWYDVLGVIDKAIPELSDAGSRTAEIALQLNDQEKIVLTHLWVFIGYYGYRLFKGFRFSEQDTGQQPFSWQLFNFRGRRARK